MKERKHFPPLKISVFCFLWSKTKEGVLKWEASRRIRYYRARVSARVA